MNHSVAGMTNIEIKAKVPSLDVVRARLAELRNDGTLVCDPDSLIRGPYLRTIPGVHPCDGFFAALLQREL